MSQMKYHVILGAIVSFSRGQLQIDHSKKLNMKMVRFPQSHKHAYFSHQIRNSTKRCLFDQKIIIKDTPNFVTLEKYKELKYAFLDRPPSSQNVRNATFHTQRHGNQSICLSEQTLLAIIFVMKANQALRPFLTTTEPTICQ